ncbi:MAG: YfiR/HmsC family protein [Bacteroidota bacterium]
MKRKIIFSLFLGIIFWQTSVAQVNRSEITGAYIYNFVKHTTWPNEKELEVFNICLLSENQVLIKELNHMAKIHEAKGKPVSLIVLKKPQDNIKDAQLVFVAADKLGYYIEVFDMIDHKPIMLVGENVENKRVVMLNLYDTEDKKLLFEINKANIYGQKLKISDEVLLMGGNEIDVLKLYLQSQESLREMDKKMVQHQKSLSLLDKKMTETNKQVEIQKVFIETQNRARDSLFSEINSLKYQMNKQKEILKRAYEDLVYLNDTLNESKFLLAGQNEKIESRKKILNKQKAEIDEMNEAIKIKDKTLGQQGETISRQRLTVYLFGAIILLIAVLVFVMYMANKDKKQKNALLREQKEKLNESYEEIKSINEKANEKNENLALTLEELGKAQLQIVQSEKMASLGVLTAGIAHEINNPINFIFAGINSIKKDFDDVYIIIDEIKKLKLDDKNINERIEKINLLKKEYYFEEATKAIPQTIIDITTGVERTTEIINGLRFFSKVGDKDFTPFSINRIIDNSLLMLKNKYKNRISVKCNYEKNISNINCNPGRLIQVFINLIDNSIDAIEDTGEITINTKELEGKVYITIKDNGQGMDKATQQKIFDPFYTTKDVGAGTGLGLAISYGIVEEHFGDIIVNSEIGKGTEFIINFPINK